MVMACVIERFASGINQEVKPIFEHEEGSVLPIFAILAIQSSRYPSDQLGLTHVT